MYIVYNMKTLAGIKSFKDKKRAQQFATKLNIGEGMELYNTTYDKLFYDKTCKRLSAQ